MASTTFAEIFAQEIRLKAVRERRDIDGLTVADEIGVSPATVSRWRSGAVPEDDTLAKIARYFGVTRAWLRYGQEPREAPSDPANEQDGPQPRLPLAPDPRPTSARGSAKKKSGTKRRAGGSRK